MMIFVHELGLATAVGGTRMEVILPPFIEAAISGFGLDYSELM